MKRQTRARLVWGTIIIVAILGAMSYTVQSNPSVTNDVTGNVQTLFNIPAVIYPFQGSPLDVVFAPAISCTITASLYGTTATGQIIPLSVQADTGVSPFHVFDIIGNGNTIFQSLTARTTIAQCSTSPSGNFQPTLVSGTVSVLWTAQKKDGTTVTLLTKPTSNIDITPLTLDSTGHTLVGNVAGKTLQLGSWTLTKDQIEQALNVQAGDSFSSVQNIDVSYNVIMHQGAATLPWSLTTGAPMISYKILENVNPTCLITCSGNTLPFDVKIDQPSNSIVNVQGLQVVKGHATLQGWTAQQGFPELKLFYTDPSSSTPTTPLYDVQLTQTLPTTSSSGSTVFPFIYAFANNTKIGKYTFTVYQNGRIGAQSADVYTTSSALQCKPTQYPFTDPATSQSYCKDIVITPQPNGTGGGGGNPPPQSCPTGQFCLPNTIPNINWNQIVAGLSTVSQTFYIIAIVIIALLVIAHFVRMKTSGKPVIDHPAVVVEETA